MTPKHTLKNEDGTYARCTTIVEAVLMEQGPMTMREIAEQLGIPERQARSCISYTKNHKKVIYISEYRRETVSGYLYPRAVYALGNEPDAKRLPRLSKKQCEARHYAKKRRLVSSVFQLGMCADDRRVTTRKRPDMRKQPVADA